MLFTIPLIDLETYTLIDKQHRVDILIKEYELNFAQLLVWHYNQIDNILHGMAIVRVFPKDMLCNKAFNSIIFIVIF